MQKEASILEFKKSDLARLSCFNITNYGSEMLALKFLISSDLTYVTRTIYIYQFYVTH